MVGSPTKDAFESHCLRVDYQAKYWLNANNVQFKWMLEQQLIQVDGNLAVALLFDVTPIVCEDCVFCPYFAMNNSHV